MRNRAIAAIALLVVAAPPSWGQDAMLRLNLASPILLGSGTPGTDPDGPTPLAVEGTALPSWVATGSPLEIRVTASGGSAPYGLPSASGASVPPFLPLPAADGGNAWDIDGTWLTPGLYRFAFGLTDQLGGFGTSDSYEVEVSPPLSVNTGTVRHHAGAPFSHQAVSGGYSVDRAATLPGLPAWMSYTPATGTISGTTPAGPAGHVQAISASDGYNTASGSLTVEVVPDPTLTVDGSTTGTTAATMTLTPTATDTIGELTWSVTGTLPQGLEGPDPMTGVISGMPVTASTASVTLRVVDAENGEATHVLPFSITEASSWTAVPLGGMSASSVIHGHAGFVATTFSGPGRLSADGTAWTSHTFPGTTNWSSVAYGNGTYVAVGVNGTASNSVATSTNGTTWTARATPKTTLSSVIFAGGKFLAVGSTGMITSPDGITWTTVSNNGGEKIAYGNSMFLVTAPANASHVYTSPDGVTWTTVPTGTPATWYNGATYGNGRFVLVSGSYLVTSEDGATFVSRTPIAAGTSWRALGYGGGKFVAIASSGTHQVAVSSDGITWTKRLSAIQSLWGLTHANGRWVAVGSNGSMWATTP